MEGRPLLRGPRGREAVQVAQGKGRLGVGSRWRAVVLVGLSLGLLAGCGRGPLASGALRSNLAYGARQASEAPAILARRFADGLKAAGFQGSVVVDGGKVTVSPAQGPTLVYDFAAGGGEVLVRLGEISIKLPVGEILSGLGQAGQGSEVLPVLLVPIATHMAMGGAQALGMYWINHRGEDFDRGDAAKAVLVGMAVSALPFVGDLKGASGLAALGTKLVATSGGFDAASLARASVALIPELVALLKAWKAQKKA